MLLFEFDTHWKMKLNTIQIRKSCSIKANSDCHFFLIGVNVCGQNKRKGTLFRFNLSSRDWGRVLCMETAKQQLLRRLASHSFGHVVCLFVNETFVGSCFGKALPKFPKSSQKAAFKPLRGLSTSL